MNIKKRISVLSACAVAALISVPVAAAAASADTAAPVPAKVQSTLVNAPSNVKSWISDISSKPDRKIVSLSQTAYHLKHKATATSTVAPAGIPTGCGLWVVIYVEDGRYVTSSSLTSCTYTVQHMEMVGGIALSAWWGWDEMTRDDTADSLENNLAMDFSYDCAGSGTHDWQTVVEGDIQTLSGDEYNADAYDVINSYHCP